MKVRIKTAPREREMDGVSLDRLEPGTVRDVSSTIASWLIVAGYAEPEMRQQPPDPDDVRVWSSHRDQPPPAAACARRRVTDP